MVCGASVSRLRNSIISTRRIPRAPIEASITLDADLPRMTSCHDSGPFVATFALTITQALFGQQWEMTRVVARGKGTRAFHVLRQASAKFYTLAGGGAIGKCNQFVEFVGLPAVTHKRALPEVSKRRVSCSRLPGRDSGVRDSGTQGPGDASVCVCMRMR